VNYHPLCVAIKGDSRCDRARKQMTARRLRYMEYN
jgi:hypothetical protein